MTPQYHDNPEWRYAHIVQAMNFFMAPGQITELRALDACVGNRNWPGTVSGYFTDWSALAYAAVYEITSAKGVYFVPNLIDPALIARAANRVRVLSRSDASTSDGDVRRRSYLLVDCDPVRPSGISATNAEHDQAIATASLIAEALCADGWPQPIMCDSGNGAHLMYRIDLPADDGGLVKGCLCALASRFDSASLKVDQSVFNPARIWKLPGTWAAKGDRTDDRPHRIAQVLQAPPALTVVDDSKLRALANLAPEVAVDARPQRAAAYRGSGFDLPAWIVNLKLDVTGPFPWQGGQRWVFRVCPWNDAHQNGSAFLIQMANGAISAGCHHAGCVNKKWHDLRDLVEPGWREHRKTNPSIVLPAGTPSGIALQFDRAVRRRSTR